MAVVNTALEIYAYFFSLLILGSVSVKITLKLAGKYERTPKAVQTEELILLPLYCVGLVGMFGFVYQRGLVTQLFWQVCTLFLFTSLVFSFWLPKTVWLKSALSTRTYWLSLLIANALALPFFYMLFSYAFFSEDFF